MLTNKQMIAENHKDNHDMIHVNYNKLANMMHKHQPVRISSICNTFKRPQPNRKLNPMFQMSQRELQLFSLLLSLIVQASLSSATSHRSLIWLARDEDLSSQSSTTNNLRSRSQDSTTRLDWSPSSFGIQNQSSTNIQQFKNWSQRLPDEPSLELQSTRRSTHLHSSQSSLQPSIVSSNEPAQIDGLPLTGSLQELSGNGTSSELSSVSQSGSKLATGPTAGWEQLSSSSSPTNNSSSASASSNNNQLAPEVVHFDDQEQTNALSGLENLNNSIHQRDRLHRGIEIGLNQRRPRPAAREQASEEPILITAPTPLQLGEEDIKEQTTEDVVSKAGDQRMLSRVRHKSSTNVGQKVAQPEFDWHTEQPSTRWRAQDVSEGDVINQQELMVGSRVGASPMVAKHRSQSLQKQQLGYLDLPNESVVARAQPRPLWPISGQIPKLSRRQNFQQPTLYVPAATGATNSFVQPVLMDKSAAGVIWPSNQQLIHVGQLISQNSAPILPSNRKRLDNPNLEHWESNQRRSLLNNLGAPLKSALKLPRRPTGFLVPWTGSGSSPSSDGRAAPSMVPGEWAIAPGESLESSFYENSPSTASNNRWLGAYRSTRPRLPAYVVAGSVPSQPIYTAAELVRPSVSPAPSSRLPYQLFDDRHHQLYAPHGGRYITTAGSNRHTHHRLASTPKVSGFIPVVAVSVTKTSPAPQTLSPPELTASTGDQPADQSSFNPLDEYMGGKNAALSSGTIDYGSLASGSSVASPLPIGKIQQHHHHHQARLTPHSVHHQMMGLEHSPTHQQHHTTTVKSAVFGYLPHQAQGPLLDALRAAPLAAAQGEHLPASAAAETSSEDTPPPALAGASANAYPFTAHNEIVHPFGETPSEPNANHIDPYGKHPVTATLGYLPSASPILFADRNGQILAASAGRPLRDGPHVLLARPLGPPARRPTRAGVAATEPHATHLVSSTSPPNIHHSGSNNLDEPIGSSSDLISSKNRKRSGEFFASAGQLLLSALPLLLAPTLGLMLAASSPSVSPAQRFHAPIGSSGSSVFTSGLPASYITGVVTGGPSSYSTTNPTTERPSARVHSTSTQSPSHSSSSSSSHSSPVGSNSTASSNSTTSTSTTTTTTTTSRPILVVAGPVDSHDLNNNHPSFSERNRSTISEPSVGYEGVDFDAHVAGLRGRRPTMNSSSHFDTVHYDLTDPHESGQLFPVSTWPSMRRRTASLVTVRSTAANAGRFNRSSSQAAMVRPTSLEPIKIPAKIQQIQNNHKHLLVAKATSLAGNSSNINRNIIPYKSARKRRRRKRQASSSSESTNNSKNRQNIDPLRRDSSLSRSKQLEIASMIANDDSETNDDRLGDDDQPEVSELLGNPLLLADLEPAPRRIGSTPVDSNDWPSAVNLRPTVPPLSSRNRSMPIEVTSTRVKLFPNDLERLPESFGQSPTIRRRNVTLKPDTKRALANLGTLLIKDTLQVQEPVENSSASNDQFDSPSATERSIYRDELRPPHQMHPQPLEYHNFTAGHPMANHPHPHHNTYHPPPNQQDQPDHHHHHHHHHHQMQDYNNPPLVTPISERASLHDGPSSAYSPSFGSNDEGYPNGHAYFGSPPIAPTNELGQHFGSGQPVYQMVGAGNRSHAHSHDPSRSTDRFPAGSHYASPSHIPRRHHVDHQHHNYPTRPPPISSSYYGQANGHHEYNIYSNHTTSSPHHLPHYFRSTQSPSLTGTASLAGHYHHHHHPINHEAHIQNQARFSAANEELPPHQHRPPLDHQRQYYESDAVHTRYQSPPRPPPSTQQPSTGSGHYFHEHPSHIPFANQPSASDSNRAINDYLNKVQFSDSDRDKLMASYLTCDGLLNDNDHCLERLACEFSDPQNIEKANKLDRAVSSILLGHILINTYIPNQFKMRLKSASYHGYTQTGRCSKFICHKLAKNQSTSSASRSANSD